MARRKRKLRLTVRKNGRRWTLRTRFKSMASMMRAKRGLRTKGWR